MGYTPNQIAEKTGRTREAIWIHRKNLIADGELTPDQARYQKAGPIEERKWYKTIERAIKEQRFYDERDIVPTGRKKIYRLLDLAVQARRGGQQTRNWKDRGFLWCQQTQNLKNIRDENICSLKHFTDTLQMQEGV